MTGHCWFQGQGPLREAAVCKLLKRPLWDHVRGILELTCQAGATGQQRPRAFSQWSCIFSEPLADCWVMARQICIGQQSAAQRI